MILRRLHSLLCLAILIAPSMSLALPKFSPELNSSIQVDTLATYNRNVTKPLNLRGQIIVTLPKTPKGKKKQCWIITKHIELPDILVCQTMTIFFSLKEISSGGYLRWKIKENRMDAKTQKISWSSPYRVAEFIGASLKTPRWIPIRLCEALPGSHKILLHPFLAKSPWTFSVPEKHELWPQLAEPPNLYYHSLPLESLKPGEKVDLSNLPEPYNIPRIYRSDKVTAHWAIPRRDAFRTTSDAFMVESNQAPAAGECRYHLKDAQDNPNDGWIECHNGFDYEVVKVNISCIEPFRKTF